MRHHYFRITNCDGGTIEHLAEIADMESAWTETTKVFGDLARGCGLKEKGGLRIELLGPGKQALYRVPPAGETCEAAASACRTADKGEPY